jgi:hypothetical protein
VYTAPPTTRWLTNYSDRSYDFGGSDGDSTVLVDGRGGRGVPPHPHAFQWGLLELISMTWSKGPSPP